MPQVSQIVLNNGSPLATQDYAIGLDQLYGRAEAVRKQRNANQRMANIVKQTMLNQGLGGEVNVADEGSLQAKATDETLKRYFGVAPDGTLNAGQTTDQALMGLEQQRNDFYQAPTVKATPIDNMGKAAATADALVNAANTPQTVAAYNKVAQNIQNSPILGPSTGGVQKADPASILNQLLNQKFGVVDPAVGGTADPNVNPPYALPKENKKAAAASAADGYAEAAGIKAAENNEDPKAAADAARASAPDMPPEASTATDSSSKPDNTQASVKATDTTATDTTADNKSAKVKSGEKKNIEQDAELAYVNKLNVKNGLITESTAGGVHNDPVGYSMRSLLSNQNMFAAFAAGGNSPVGEQMNPYDQLVRAKIQGVNDMNKVQNEAMKTTVTGDAGGMEIGLDKLKLGYKEGYAQNQEFNIHNYGPRGDGGGDPNKEESFVTVGNVQNMKPMTSSDGTALVDFINSEVTFDPRYYNEEYKNIFNRKDKNGNDLSVGQKFKALRDESWGNLVDKDLIDLKNNWTKNGSPFGYGTAMVGGKALDFTIGDNGKLTVKDKKSGTVIKQNVTLKEFSDGYKDDFESIMFKNKSDQIMGQVSFRGETKPTISGKGVPYSIIKNIFGMSISNQPKVK